MAISLKWVGLSIVAAIVAVLVTVIFKEDLLIFRSHPSEYPKPLRDYWGKDPSTKASDDISIRSYIPFEKLSNKDEKIV